MLRPAHPVSLLLLAALLGPSACTAYAQDAPESALTCAAFPYDAPFRAAPDTTYDLTHADVSADVSDDGTFSGRVALDFRLARDADSLVVVHRGGAVDSAFFGAAPVGVALAPGDTFRLALPDTVRTGSAARMVVYHRGRLGQPAPEVVSALETFIPWFPSSPNAHDRFTADLHITVPASWSVIATGIPTGQETSDDGRMTFRYSSPYELPGRRIGFAAGAVDLGTAFAVLPGGRRPAVTWWMPRVRSSDRPRSPHETIAVAIERLAFYSEWTGFPLPFERYTQLLVDGAPAASGGVARVPPYAEPDDRSATPYEPPPALTEPLLQQWFGTLISAESWQHVWLEEAFPAFLHVLALSSAEARQAAMTALRNDYLAWGNGGRPLVRSRWNHPSELIDSEASSRGAWVLHMMRQEIGDEPFREAVRLFLDSSRYRTVTTTDWLRAIEAVAESDHSAFVDEWIYRGGHPVLGVSYAAVGDALRVRIEQLQSGEGVPDVYTLDLTLEIGMLGTSERFDVRVDARDQVFDLPLSAQPRFVAVDPDGRWLLESDVDQSASAWLAQLRYATSSIARLAAARALSGTPPDPALLLGLRASLEAESSPEVRASIIEAMGHLRPSAAAERAIIAAYADPEARVRRAVLKELAESASTEASSELALHAAETDASYEVQAEAVRTLARMGAANAVDVARAALVTPSHDEIIRAAGLDALAQLRERVPGEALEEGLRFADDGHPLRLRLAAVRLLARLAPASGDALDRLVTLLNDADPVVAASTVEALREAGLAPLAAERIGDVSGSRLNPLLRCP